MREINLLDLFSGIGGFHLGLERAGFKVNAYNSEIDKYAIDVYKHNFKNATYVGSVTDVRAEQLPRIDAITFGSPCQDFSLAGKRKGMGGARSSLITEAIRLINECRPSFFIWENVKGTFSSNNGADFWAIIQAFANIGDYRLEWQLLNTKWFLPQNRERIYLVGYIGDGGGGQIFPIGSNDSKIDAPVDRANTCTITARYKASTSQGSYINELYKVSSATKKGYEIAQEGDSINLSVPTSKTRRGRVGKGQAQTLDTHCNQAVIGTKLNSNNGTQPHQQDRIYDSEGISPALMRGKSDLIVKIGDFRNDEGYRERKDGNSPTLNARARDDIYGQPIVNKIRRLTPIECERLQGFPDNWTKYGTKGEISDSQRYKMCGNAVTVDVVQSVAKNILKVL
jgi:DNA (cytosine-5)-methyltransferase 1